MDDYIDPETGHRLPDITDPDVIEGAKLLYAIWWRTQRQPEPIGWNELAEADQDRFCNAVLAAIADICDSLEPESNRPTAVGASP